MVLVDALLCCELRHYAVYYFYRRAFVRKLAARGPWHHLCTISG